MHVYLYVCKVRAFLKNSYGKYTLECTHPRVTILDTSVQTPPPPPRGGCVWMRDGGGGWGWGMGGGVGGGGSSGCGYSRAILGSPSQ